MKSSVKGLSKAEQRLKMGEKVGGGGGLQCHKGSVSLPVGASGCMSLFVF